MLAERVACFIREFNREGTRRRVLRIRSASICDAELAAFQGMLESLPHNVPAASILCAFSTCLPRAEAAPDTAAVEAQAASV